MDFDATLKNTRQQSIHQSRVLCRYWERNGLLKQMRKKKTLSKTLSLIALQECIWSKLVSQYNNLLASLQHHSKQGRGRTLRPAYTQDMWWFYNLLKGRGEGKGRWGGDGGWIYLSGSFESGHAKYWRRLVLNAACFTRIPPRTIAVFAPATQSLNSTVLFLLLLLLLLLGTLCRYS
jgi:hypothetical protein